MNQIIKDDSEFLKLIDKDKYQLFLFSSKCHIPFSFARHNWFVANQKGKLKRWELFYKKNRKSQLGYIWNYEKGFSRALRKFLWNKNSHWKESNLEEIIQGEKAKKIINFIENSINEYPFKENYLFYPGPNSNTYVQWIIDNSPELNIQLSWNSFGKNYKRK
jgi:hypothetical protein